MMHDRVRNERPFDGGREDDEHRDEGDDDLIPLHGVVLPQSAADASKRTAPSASANDEQANTLTLRAFDEGVPSRDFQPRLLRFGEAA